jgi:adenosylhomocysteine nucleosidase
VLAVSADPPADAALPELAVGGDECLAAFVAASAAELGGLEDLLHDKVLVATASLVLRRGTLHGWPVVLAAAGEDAAALVHTVDVLLDGHRPAWVVFTGFATSLGEEVPRGAVVIANALVDVDGAGQPLELPDAAQLSGRLGHADVRLGPLCCTSESLDRAQRRRDLGAPQGALAAVGPLVAAARHAQQRGAAVLAMYLVHRGVDDEPPAELRNLRRQRSWPGKLGALVGALVRRPGSVKDLYREREQSLLDTDRLGSFLAGVLELLATPHRTA